MADYTYNLHNIIGVTIRGEDNNFVRYCRKELDGFESVAFDGAIEKQPQHIHLSIGPVPNDSDHILSLGKGVFLEKDHDKILLSRDANTSLFRAEDIYASIMNAYTLHKSSIDIRVNPYTLLQSPSFSRPASFYKRYIKLDPRTPQERAAESFFSQVLEPLFYRCYLASGWVLLHAAAVERDNRVCLILGPQNIGKTSFTVELARRGWNMLGDDMCLLSRSGDVLAHPKPLKIENEHFKRDTSFHKSIALSHSKLAGVVNSIYRWIVKRHGSFEFKASPSELSIPLAHEGALRSIFVLQRWNKSESVQLPSVTSIPYTEASTLLGQHVAAEVDVNKRLDSDIRHMLTLHGLGPASLSLLTDQAQSIIDEASRDKDCFLLNMHVPDRIAVDAFEETLIG